MEGKGVEVLKMGVEDGEDEGEEEEGGAEGALGRE